MKSMYISLKNMKEPVSEKTLRIFYLIYIHIPSNELETSPWTKETYRILFKQ